MSFFTRSKSGKNLDKFVRSKTAADVNIEEDKSAGDQDNALPGNDQFGTDAVDRINK